MIEHYQRPKQFEDAGGEVPEDGRACPACKRIDATSKVSSVARANRGRFVLEDGTAAAYESELGGLLSRPPRPELLPVSIIVGAIVVGWVLLALDLAIVAGLRAQDQVAIPAAALGTATWLGFAWFGLLIPGAALLRYLARREAVSQELPAWRDAAQRWQTFHYCARDDLVYVPGEGHGVAPEHVALLYRAAARMQPIALKQREVQA
jgi:hypothetical protein